MASFPGGKAERAEEERRREAHVARPRRAVRELADDGAGQGLDPGEDGATPAPQDRTEVEALVESFGNLGPPSSASSSAPADTEGEMLTLAGGLRVPKKRFQEARRDTGMEYVQNLAVLLFTRDELAGSSLTGMKGRGDGPQKPKLDADRVQAIKELVMKDFPEMTEADVKEALRRKCNNESTRKKKEDEERKGS